MEPKVTKTSSWITEKQREQNKWRANSYSYKVLIDKLLALDGDFVFISKKGDPLIELLVKKAIKFTYRVKYIGTKNDIDSRKIVLSYAQKDPKRYRVCVGYTLVLERAISFWVKNYWIFDKTDNSIIECTLDKTRFYFGIILSQEGSTKVTQTANQNKK